MSDRPEFCPGDIPYRDFYANYGPAQFYALAVLFKVFGPSVVVERLWDLLIRSCTVQRRHRTRQDPTAKAVAHNELIAGAQLFDEGVEPVEIITVVAVAHDHVFAVRRTNAGEKSAAISRSAT